MIFANAFCRSIVTIGGQSFFGGVHGRASSQRFTRLLKLPQNPEHGGYGYYTYGTPTHGAGQFVHPKLLSIISMVEHRWQGMDDRKIGFGNISLAGGEKYDPHEGHQSGLDVDIRAIRKDGRQLPVKWTDAQYDREATTKLINLFFQSCAVKVIYFNDPKINRVMRRFKHDNHFHVTVFE